MGKGGAGIGLPILMQPTLQVLAAISIQLPARTAAAPASSQGTTAL